MNLLASVPPTAPGQAPSQGRVASNRETPDTSFAQVLEQGRPDNDPLGTEGRAGGNPQRPDLDQATETPGSADPGALAWAAGTAPPPLQAWPPAGLAGLDLSGAGLSPPESAGGEAGDGALRGALSAGQAKGSPGQGERALSALQPAAAAALPAAMAAQASAMDSTAPAAAVAADGTSVMTDGVEPAAAFALPALAGSPAAVAGRESVPLLAPPPGTPTPDLRGQDFGERFGAQLHWMAEQNIGHARIRVSPQELGPVEVMLSLDGDRISADFISVHAETRQALEQGLPRLRELLGEHGFHLAHADVGSHGSATRHGDEAHAPAPGRPLAGDDADASARPSGTASTRIARGLIDAYA